jgi:hypothetical protein
LYFSAGANGEVTEEAEASPLEPPTAKVAAEPAGDDGLPAISPMEIAMERNAMVIV